MVIIDLFIDLLASGLAFLSSVDDSFPDETDFGEHGPDPDPDPDQNEPDPDKDDSNNDNKSRDKGKGKARAITPEDTDLDKPNTDKDDSNNDGKSLDKGKGKARAITPEDNEYYTDLDEQRFQDDMEKAKYNSLEDFKSGESSKQGAYREYQASIEKEKKLDEYRYTERARKEALRGYNDIMDKIEREGDFMHPSDKEYLLNKSVERRTAFDNYNLHSQELKNELNINSSDEEFSSGENSSEES